MTYARMPIRTGANKPSVSLVICTLDEADSIGAVLREAHDALSDIAYEIIVVDDSAEDRTASVVRAHAAADDRIRLVRRKGVRGLASAAITGWDIAQGEIIGVMDGDGQHDTGLLKDLIGALVTGHADVAMASRFMNGTHTGLGRSRHRLSCLGTRLVHAALGVKTSDPLSGFFFMRRAWFDHVRGRLSGVGFKILVDVLTCGERAPRVVERPTMLRSRIGGASKLDSRIVVELAAQLVQNKTRGIVPARFFMFAGVGATGVVVHLAILSLLKGPAALPFWLAQAGAIGGAMSSNFFLNNTLTFRDLRLRGRELWRGLLAFYVTCSAGALLSEMIGSSLNHFGVSWILAGATGAISAAFWNYWSSSRATWAYSHRPADAAQGEPVRDRSVAQFGP